MRYLSEQDVSRLLTMREAVEAVEEAFRQLSEGGAENVPRRRAKAQGIVLHSMSAAAGYLGLVGWKNYTTTAAGAKFHVGLYSAESGALVALIEADKLGQMRTGAASAVASKWLAREGSETLGLFGSGWQAESQLEAHVAALPIRRAKVYSRDAGRRKEFCKKMSGRLEMEVEPVEDPQLAARELPIVITATSSRTPVLEGEWLSPGTHVCAMGSNWLSKAEVDVETVRRAGRIVCDSLEACQLEAGDLVPALEAGEFRWDQAVELADVVAGKVAGRSSDEVVTLFKSVGLAVEDLAVGAVVLKKAEEAIGA